MKAALLEKERTFKIVEAPDPEPGKNEVVIQVRSVGICGSEVEAFFGRHPFRKPPVITGHEMSGVIVKVGEEVSALKIGDRVTLEPQVSCGSCVYCRSGKYNLCRNRIMLGTEKWSGPFGEFIKAPASKIIPLPEGITFDEAALVEPLAVGVHSVRKSRLAPGDSLIVFGAGTIGLCTVVAARAMGIREIVIVDISDVKLKMGQRMGASDALNAKNPYLLERIQQIFPEGADVAIVATGAGEAYQASPKVVKRDGRIGVVGLCREGILVPIELGGAGTELEVIGCSTYLHVDFREAVRILPNTPLREIISRTFPIDRIQEAFETFIQENEALIKVILHHPSV
jgi:threonine dehydrogenase-like Zn-dependent dehydrogenase